MTLALAGVAVSPLLYPGFFHNHAGLLPAYLSTQIDGINWAPTMGGALPSGTGLAPFYLLALFQRLGFAPGDAIKLLHAAALILGAAGSYASGARLGGLVQERDESSSRWPLAESWPAGMVCASVYTFIPYHLAATYVRGDVSEALALALAPLWIAAALTGDGTKRPRALKIALPILGALLLLSHPGIALATFALGFGLLMATQRLTGGRMLEIGAGLGLGLVLWLPALARSGIASAPVLQFVQPAFLGLSRWGYGVSPADGLPIQLGAVAIGAACLIWAVRSGPYLRWVRLVLSGAAAGLMLLSLDAASIAWGPLRLLFSEPWQTLAVASMALALLAAFLPSRAGTGGAATTGALSLLAIAASFSFLQPVFVPGLNPGEPVLARFGDRIALLDFQVLEASRAQLVVAIDWQALEDGREDDTMFVHVLAPDGRLLAQRDQPPFEGARMTSGWAKGEVIRDRYRITLPTELPPGMLPVEVGIYRSADVQRLAVSGARIAPGDHLILTRLSPT